MLATMQEKATEVRRVVLRVLLCCAVLSCSEDRTILTAPSAGSGGSGGVSGSGNSASAGAGGGGAAGVAGGGGSTGDERDASADASPDAADAASLCCEPSPQPECCMVYGGRRSGGCDVVCDGMPLPNAGWQLGADSYGCAVWIEPPRTNDCCGCAPPDSGI
jgi:hypothetical protein